MQTGRPPSRREVVVDVASCTTGMARSMITCQKSERGEKKGGDRGREGGREGVKEEGEREGRVSEWVDGREMEGRREEGRMK